MTRFGRRRARAHPSRQRRPTTAPGPDAPTRWPERRWLATSIRVLVFIAPIVLSFLVALALSRAIDVPDGFWERVVRWIGIAVVATTVMIGAQRLLRRLLPLAALFSLTLVVPDETPSRFGIALRSMSARHLERRLREVDRDGLGDTPAEAVETMLGLVASLSRHDRMTRGHSERVRAYVVMIGEEMDLSADEIDALRWAGLLHDVGKLHVPSEILNKPGTLTDDEFAVIRQHPGAGRDLVAPLADWLGPSAAAVYEHHERWEGGGYPTGVRSERLSLSSRVVSVADAFDVMTSARSYKTAMSASDARSELQRCAGTQFDPAVVRAMMNISLGRLWRAMGPMSWVAQLGLFPRPVAQAGPAVNAAVAAIVSLLLTSLATVATTTSAEVLTQLADVDEFVGAQLAGDDSSDAPSTPASSAESGSPGSRSTSNHDETTVPTAPSTSPIDVVVPQPPISTTPPPTSSTSTSIPLIAVLPPLLTTTTAPANSPISTTSTSVATTTTTPTTTASTTTTTSTTSAPTSTTSTTIATTTTTTQPTTTTSTSTTVPPSPGVLVLASPGVGDQPSSPVLPLVADRPPRNATVPNYDTDRNDDPGLTIVASRNGLLTSTPDGVQVWALPAATTELSGPASLTVWLAPDGPQNPGLLEVRAGLFDCDLARTDCVRLVRDTVKYTTSIIDFAPVEFDLSIGGGHVVESGRRVELRLATLQGSSNDLWVAYDAVDTPSTLTIEL